MKKIFLLVMLALSICSSCLAMQTPCKEDLKEVQKTFGGIYFAQEPELIDKYGVIDLRFYDNSAEIYFEGEKHVINPSNLQIDYNNGFTAHVFGKCTEPNCDLLYFGFSIHTRAKVIVPKATSFLLLVSKVTKDKKTEDVNVWVTKM